MKDVDAVVESVRRMTIDELLAAAGSPAVTALTYLYVDVEGDLCWMEKSDSGSPADEYFSIGYVRKHHGGARYSTRPDAKPRGPAPDLVKAARHITAAIKRHGVKIDQRDQLYAALSEAQQVLDELDKAIIL